MLRVKYFILLLFCISFTTEVAFGQEEGDFDQRIGKIVAKIQQYPQRTRDLEELRVNFDQAVQADKRALLALQEAGQPDRWMDIYKIYTRLQDRQLLVRSIPESSLKASGINLEDYTLSLKDSRYKAIAYYYAHAEKLLSSGGQPEAKAAYFELMKAASLDPTYKELDKLLRTAILKSATAVEFELDNRTGRAINPAVVGQLTEIIWQFKKAKYGQEPPTTDDRSFVFALRVVLDDLTVGPDQIKELQYQEERDVFNGQRAVDTIRCQVTEYRQLKKARLEGRLEYIDQQTGQVVNRVPVSVESVFANAYGSLQGNPDAAGEETRRLLQSRKVEYPSADRMTADVTEEFVKKSREVILAP